MSKELHRESVSESEKSEAAIKRFIKRFIYKLHELERISVQIQKNQFKRQKILSRTPKTDREIEERNQKLSVLDMETGDLHMRAHTLTQELRETRDKYAALTVYRIPQYI